MRVLALPLALVVAALLAVLLIAAFSRSGRKTSQELRCQAASDSV
jgi:lipopolysaccharide export LptBFGC system permease protein LptF